MLRPMQILRTVIFVYERQQKEKKIRNCEPIHPRDINSHFALKKYEKYEKHETTTN